jgi:YebC/PmpR family DNA-binding regulatory protein
MGRQWLQKNKEIAGAKRGKIFTKLLREITVAAGRGLPDPNANARLAVAVEAARKQSVPNDSIKRAIAKGGGLSGPKEELQLVTFEGFAPHKVPVIVECMTDNRNRTAPDMRSLFDMGGQFGAKIAFLFEHVGLVEATHEGEGLDIETAAIEAGAQNVEPLEKVEEGHTGARFTTERADLDSVTAALRGQGWSVTTSELGYVGKEPVELAPEARKDVEEFLERIDDHDDVHRVWPSLR